MGTRVVNMCVAPLLHHLQPGADPAVGLGGFGALLDPQKQCSLPFIFEKKEGRRKKRRGRR